MFRVTVLPTGLANIASVLAAFERIGVPAALSEDPAAVRAAHALVLPGVGAFGPGMGRLRELGLTEEIKERVSRRQPTLAVCLGLQLLADESEETPGIEGLHAVSGKVVRFSDKAGLRVPQLGWNEVVPQSRSSLITAGFAYFANSYCLRAEPSGFNAAYTEYDGTFVSAFEDGPVLACQFHPELSGSWGQSLIARWCELARGESK